MKDFGTDIELAELSRACRILELEGHGDFTLGHAALRDTQGRGFWMKRNAAGLGEICGPEDFVLVSMTGSKLFGSGGRHSEWPIHSEIFRRRPEINVTFHTHPLYGCIMSGIEEDLVPFTLEADYFMEVPRHIADVALIKTVEQGEAMAATLGANKAMFLANHGVVFCGASVGEAACIGVFLEHACRAHIIGKSTGSRALMPSRDTRNVRHSQVMTSGHVEHTWAYLNRKLEDTLGTSGVAGAIYR